MSGTRCYLGQRSNSNQRHTLTSKIFQHCRTRTGRVNFRSIRRTYCRRSSSTTVSTCRSTGAHFPRRRPSISWWYYCYWFDFSSPTKKKHNQPVSGERSVTSSIIFWKRNAKTNHEIRRHVQRARERWKPFVIELTTRPDAVLNNNDK